MAKWTKRSAGLLIISGRKLLLLRRRKRAPNGGTWGLPGGQLDRRETPLEAACREGDEELGKLPAFEVLARLKVQRRNLTKRYDVFLCEASRSVRERWHPELSKEHDDFAWVRLEWCLGHPDELHPVVAVLLQDPKALAAIGRALEGVDPVPPRAARPMTGTVAWSRASS